MIDEPSIIKIILDIIKLEAKVNVHEMKDKLRIVDIVQFKGDISKILQEMEEMYNNILAEGDTYQDFVVDLLKALWTIQDKIFLYTLERLQDTYDSGKDL